MAKLSSKKKAQAKQNAKRRGKRVGAYDNLRASGKKMKATSGKKKKK